MSCSVNIPEAYLRSAEQRLDQFVVFDSHVEGLQELGHKGVHHLLCCLVLLVDDLQQATFFHHSCGVKKNN